MGQDKAFMENTLTVSPAPIFEVSKDGLFVNVMKAQRLNRSWDNPVVIKIQEATFRDSD
jgi:hypothetical protein